MPSPYRTPSIEFERVRYFGNLEDLRSKEVTYRIYNSNLLGYVYRDNQGWHARDIGKTIFICQADKTRQAATNKLLYRLGVTE